MDTVVIILVAVLPSITAGVVGWLLHRKVDEIHLSFNSRFDKLIAVAKAEGLAEGRAEREHKI